MPHYSQMHNKSGAEVKRGFYGQPKIDLDPGIGLTPCLAFYMRYVCVRMCACVCLCTCVSHVGFELIRRVEAENGTSEHIRQVASPYPFVILWFILV